MATIAIVGIGLMGGSLGLSLRKRSTDRVWGWDVSAHAVGQALQRAAVEKASTDPSSILPEADIVVLCVPVRQMAASLKRILPFLKEGVVVTDVGSVKSRLLRELQPVLARRRDISFVGGHPLAGSEKSGVHAADADLFQQSVCVLTPLRGGSKKALAAVTRLWKTAGARAVTLTPEKHDRVLALTSHLPHLIAFSFFHLASQAASKDPLVRQLTAGSFRDMTRIVSSNPDVWAGILQMNQKELQTLSRAFMSRLQSLLRRSPQRLAADLKQLARARRAW